MANNSGFYRYREAGDEVNGFNENQYGKPARSLFSSTKAISVHRKMEITDSNGSIVYRAESKAFSFHDRTFVYDSNNQQVAEITKKMFTMHERHFVTMSDGFKFELSNELWHIYKDITNLEGLGWQLRGNMFGFNFELFDSSNQPVAIISQKMFSLHDKYCVDIYQPEQEAKVVAILVAVQHMIRDRETARSSSNSASLYS